MDATFGPEWSASLRRVTPDELSDWLALALACCDLADRQALDAFRSQFDIERKPDGSYVTPVDRAIEQAIGSLIVERFPAHEVVGEEYGTNRRTGSTRWLVDPIDGTHNFMRGIPVFATLVAVEHQGETQVAVVSAPALGQRWWAGRGMGAWATDAYGQHPRSLRVSPVATVAASQLLYRAVGDMRASRVAAGFERLIGVVGRERGFGDFWGYMLVAEGAADILVEQDLKSWDMAAPWLIVEEAGGRVTDFAGLRSQTAGESLATNGRVHREALEHLARG